MIGIGTPSSQSRIPRPMVVSSMCYLRQRPRTAQLNEIGGRAICKTLSAQHRSERPHHYLVMPREIRCSLGPRTVFALRLSTGSDFSFIRR